MIRSILVALTQIPSEKLLSYCQSFAQRFQAEFHLVLYNYSEEHYPEILDEEESFAGISLPDLSPGAREVRRESVQTLESEFLSRLKESGLKGSFHSINQSVKVHLRKEIHKHDLLLVNRDEEFFKDHFLFSDPLLEICQSLSRNLLALPSEPEPYHLNKVLLATDGSEQATRALDYLASLNELKEFEIHLACCGTMALSEPGKVLEEASSFLKHHEIHPREHILDGDPCACICKLATHEKPDLVCLGAKGNSSVLETFLGSTTREVLDQLDLPVLVCH